MPSEFNPYEALDRHLSGEEPLQGSLEPFEMIYPAPLFTREQAMIGILSAMLRNAGITNYRHREEMIDPMIESAVYIADKLMQRMTPPEPAADVNAMPSFQETVAGAIVHILQKAESYGFRGEIRIRSGSPKDSILIEVGVATFGLYTSGAIPIEQLQGARFPDDFLADVIKGVADKTFTAWEADRG